MKILKTLILLIAFPFLVQAQTLKKLDGQYEYGFRDLVFGTPVAKLSGFKLLEPLVEGNKDLGVFERPSDELKFGNAELHRILYIFDDRGLSAITIHAKGLTNSRALLKAVTDQYGPPSFTEGNMSFWEGKKAIMAYTDLSGNSGLNIQIQDF